MNFAFKNIDYLVLVIYLVALFVTGFYLSEHKTRENGDMFLGGRSLKWWQIGFSLFSANAGPMMLVGFASLGFSQGVVGSNFEWLAWVFLLLLAMFFLPHYLSTKISTMPQFLLLRFGQRSFNFLVIYSLFSILFVWLGSALYAGGLIISQIFGWTLLKSIILVALIACSFTAMGGFKAVVRTGIFQSAVIILSSMLLTFFAFKKIGGVSALISATPPHYWKLFRSVADPEYSWVAILTGYPVVAIYYWCTDQTIVQKVLAAKDLREGQRGAMFIAFLKILMPFIFIFPGIFCYVLFKDIAKPDNAYITLVQQLMPGGLQGLCIAALVAALIDTVSSGLNSFSTILTLDVVAKIRPMDAASSRNMGRWLTLVAAVLSVGIAYLYANSGKGFFELSQGLVSILAPPLSVVFLAGIMWKRVNSLAAESVLYGGGIICLIVGACHILNYPSPNFWPHFLRLSVYLFVLLTVVIILVTLCTKKQEGYDLPSPFESKKPGTKNASAVWLGWAILAAIMFLLYMLFS